jgi:hypothetical protein
MTVTFSNGFVFQSATDFYFPNIYELAGQGFQYKFDQLAAILKCYRLLGATVLNSFYRAEGGANFIYLQNPCFLYTPYIDILSNNLTKFQKIKDTDTAPSKRTSMISRVYLSGVGNPQLTSAAGLGTQPFIMTADLNTPKTIRWSPDETVFNLDFTVNDFYGDPIYWDANFPTEFQMTLLCAEGE